MSTSSASQSKALNKKELKRFQEMLEEKRKVVVDAATSPTFCAGFSGYARTTAASP